MSYQFESEHNSGYRRKREILEQLWASFNMEFPENEDALEELYKRACEADWINCRSCGASDFDRKRGDRVGKCNSCGDSLWLFADTFFCGMRTKTATAWLAAIYFKEQGQLFSASMFHAIVGVAQSTAHGIIKKIEFVQASQMPDEAALLPSLRFMRIFSKRSRETPAREHPQSEENFTVPDQQEEFRDGASETDNIRKKFAESFEMEEDTGKVLNCFSNGSLSTEEICQSTGLDTRDVSSALSFLELIGCIQRLPGDRHELKEKPEEPKDASSNHRELIEEVEKFLKAAIESWHGISRKYLQLYLAAYCGHVSGSKWRDGRLLFECIRFGPVKYSDVLMYVSPPSVSFSFR